LKYIETKPLGIRVNTEGYRFGFNGKENDNEIKGTGNQQDYGMRIYDPRLGRFLSTDPLTKSYPWFTPYQFASNTPIQAIDIDGMEAWVVYKDYYYGINLPKVMLFFDKDLKNADGVYVVHRYYNTKNQMDGIRWNIESFEASPNLFTSFKRADGKGAFTIDAKSIVTYGGIETQSTKGNINGSGFKAGTNITLFGYDGSLYDSNKGVTALDKNNLQYLSKEGSQVEVVGGVALQTKYGKFGIETSEKVDLKTGSVTESQYQFAAGPLRYTDNSANGESYSIEYGASEQYIIGYDVKISASVNFSKVTIGLDNLQMAKDAKNTMQRDNLIILAPRNIKQESKVAIKTEPDTLYGKY
jgi:RHS repeat-associated protein